MTAGVSSVTAVRSGLCPHGLPPGACPICSGMGGSSNKVQTADFSAKPGEMSWNECAAIGAFLKSLKNARLAREADYQSHLLNIAMFEKNMVKASQNLANFIQTLSGNALTKPVAVLLQNVAMPILQHIKNVPVNIMNTIATISQKLADISDKLTAIYGELKAAINKKVSDFFNKVKKKLVSIFMIFTPNNDADENELMVELEKKLAKLKQMLNKITRKLPEKKKKNANNK
ncbi:TPA: hypothetical protein CPT80_05045 [Candidatus Gastranaerophilales bacterium HUM_9]|nr:MAG TPA: hypothetical protein CPT80_05045 [Candidatus Gastranaerophilales bacterium HUM_9]HBX34803.1 hypothetical protein [Cyanobacteria bacterium UBA11440]